MEEWETRMERARLKGREGQRERERREQRQREREGQRQTLRGAANSDRSSTGWVSFSEPSYLFDYVLEGRFCE